MILNLSDFLANSGLDAVFTSTPDSAAIIMLVMLGGIISAAFPILSTDSSEFSIHRSFLLALFLLWPGSRAFYYCTAAIITGSLLRWLLDRRRAFSHLSGGLIFVLLLTFGPELITRIWTHINNQIAVLLILPVLVIFEVFVSIVSNEGRIGYVTSAGRTLMTYLASLPLTLMLVIMILHLGELGTVLGLVGLLGFSFIGRSINRKHEWNTRRIREISQQDRLATRLMESSSYGAFLEILAENVLSDKDSDVIALTLSTREDCWILWTRDTHMRLKSDEVTGSVPEKGKFTSDLTAGGISGTALGLSADKDLLLLFSGPERNRLRKIPDSLLENLVLLLEHTWEAVGHSMRSERSFLAAAVLLARLADAKDDYTHGHSIRVANLSCALGRHLGLSREKMRTLRVAAILHDIGKLAIPASILTKKGLLTKREREIVEAHSLEGSRIVSSLSGYEEVARIIQSHHERLDGMGYPDGLKELDIPFMARIVAVADTFDAITSDRSYHSISGWEKALKTIKDEQGSKFDARIIRALEEIISDDSQVMA
jgi:putative nucleotidyltransferase with HDIG domain